MDKVLNLISKIEFDKNDVLEEFSKYSNPLMGLVAMKKFSLAAIVKQLFRNDAGEPLELLPFQSALLWMLWHHKYPMILASRGAGKSFIYGLYAILRAILIPGSKICIVGAGFRQAKLVFDYVVKRYYTSPIIQEALQSGGGPKHAVDQCSLKVGSSIIFAIPLGDGDRIRGMRANVILCDEFASIPEEIYEIVVQPFAAVRSDPSKSVKLTSVIDKLKKHGAPVNIIRLLEEKLGFGNQICISGTATYEFNHFYRKYEMYRKMIFSGGDKENIARAFAEGNKYVVHGKVDRKLVEAFKHTDYAIFQLPYHAVPRGFMDESVIANAQLTYDPSKFNMEYLCKFAKDSDGFYKRSLIDAATPKERDVRVNIELYGERGAQYIMAFDPARHNDNFAVVILKITGRGAELVYAWTMRGKAFDLGVRKMRTLMERFNIVSIIGDQGGGGQHVVDLFCDKRMLEKGEVPIWRIDDDDAKYHDGLHILDVFQWSNEWIRDSNHAMRTEIMQKLLLFPDTHVDEELCIQQYAKYMHKQVSKVNQEEIEAIKSEIYGVVNDDGQKIQEGVWGDIQEVFNEMCAIVVKVTEGGTEQFILPSLSAQQKGQSLTDARRRDRYSALLMAAYGVRKIKGHGFKKRDLPGGGVGSFQRRGRNNIRSNNGTVWPSF